MKELRGLEKIDELVNNFCEKFGCTAEFGAEFCYYHSDETVCYSLAVVEESDKTWKEYVKDTFNFRITNIFMFSLLHEIGHHFTMDKFSPIYQRKEDAVVRKIEKNLSKSDDEVLDKKLRLQYFDLPMEKVATKWAVKYYRTHRQAINRFYRKLEKEIHKFYALNLTEDF